MFDNCLELLVLAGRSLPHAMMMMIPEPWANHATMSDEKKAFYEYHCCLMEPWDGPASIAFTDGRQIGAVLDRNGLRPSRYYVTKDDLVIMASRGGRARRAAGARAAQGPAPAGPDVPGGHGGGAHHRRRGNQTRRSPASILTGNGSTNTCSNWRTCPTPRHPAGADHETVLQRQQAFGYTYEDLRILMAPMARDGVEAVGSMGNDTPLAVLSNKPQLALQLFQAALRPGHQSAD